MGWAAEPITCSACEARDSAANRWSAGDNPGDTAGLYWRLFKRKRGW